MNTNIYTYIYIQTNEQQDRGSLTLTGERSLRKEISTGTNVATQTAEQKEEGLPFKEER